MDKNIDSDPLETQEWRQALDSVLEFEGPDRAHFLLDELFSEARRKGTPVPYSGTTPYLNTIAPERELRHPGNRAIEHRIRSLIRWNALAIVLRANKESSELGGHIASFQSAATLYDTGFQHFWHVPSEKHGGDLVYIQGHSSPGIYAKAFLEGRLTEEQLLNFREEVDGNGLSSYPHPWLMPDFWQFPTVSMGLGPLMAIYQARFLKYYYLPQFLAQCGDRRRTKNNEDTTMLKKIALLSLVISSMASVTSVASARELTSVGVTVGRLTNPFFVELGKGAEAKVKEIAGDKASVTVVAADYDLNRQYAQIDNFITSGVDLVLVNAAASNAMESSLKRLRDAGIVSVAVDVAAAGTDATVTTDNVQAGRNACQFIADRLQGSGNIIIVDGPPVSAVAHRIQGCKGVFAQHPNIKILSESQDGRVQSENGFDVATNLLNSFDKIDAIFTINDPEAITVDLAARQLRRKDFFITSVDAAPSVVEALKRQDSLILASSAQDPYLMAQKAVEIGYEILQGGKPAQDVVLIPSQLITRDNVAQYKGWTSK